MDFTGSRRVLMIPDGDRHIFWISICISGNGNKCLKCHHKIRTKNVLIWTLWLYIHIWRDPFTALYHRTKRKRVKLTCYLEWLITIIKGKLVCFYIIPTSRLCWEPRAFSEVSLLVFLCPRVRVNGKIYQWKKVLNP